MSGFALVKQHHLDRWLGTSDWVIHDLRRTVASNMARLGVRIEVADKILNHVSGKLGGIVGVYQKYEFLPERQAALDQWAAFVEGLIQKAPRQRIVRPQEQLAAE